MISRGRRGHSHVFQGLRALSTVEEEEMNEMKDLAYHRLIPRRTVLLREPPGLSQQAPPLFQGKLLCDACIIPSSNTLPVVASNIIHAQAPSVSESASHPESRCKSDKRGQMYSQIKTCRYSAFFRKFCERSRQFSFYLFVSVLLHS